ncbi:MAG: cysteine desulfurase [Planctomycetaceae bacterium]|jgi:SufS family cysteine desulfurase|nr:cysteine desulfurase [Planctomycetaceae bacterium]
MNISTLDNLVYAAVRAADNDNQSDNQFNQFAENNFADTRDANETASNLIAVNPYAIPTASSISNSIPTSIPSSIPSSIVGDDVLSDNWQTQAILQSDYMSDFFPDRSPFVENPISVDNIPSTDADISTISNTIPNSDLITNPVESKSSSLLVSEFLSGDKFVDGASMEVGEVSGIEWDVQQVGREISKTLYKNGFEDAAKVAFDLVDINSRKAANDVNGNGGVEVGVENSDVDKKTDLSSGRVSNLVSGLSREFDVVSIRNDFPILSERVHGKPLVWFDNGATTQKPRVVIERLRYFYEHENSNVHRGAHDLAARSTDAYERSREVVRKFLNASSSNEIVFVRGTTEAINLVASAWGRDNIRAGDEIVISHLEHHANIVPWQMLASEVGAVIRVIPVNSNGELMISGYADILRSGRVKLVAVTQVSNAIGTITPTEEIVQVAHQFGARVLIDGAQSVSHIPTDVQMLGADFFVFSGHKIFAPTGIGVLYGRESILNSMRPYQGGGGMISDVTFERTRYNPAPARFEAGTGNIADAVGLGAALDYVGSIGLESIRQYEHRLLEYALDEFNQISGVRVVGNASNRAAVISFLVDGFTTEEVNKILASEGIAVRAGHHCAQPILRRFGLESTVRASLAFYNTYEEIDFLIKIVKDISKKSRR